MQVVPISIGELREHRSSVEQIRERCDRLCLSIVRTFNDDLREKCFLCAVCGNLKDVTGAIYLTTAFRSQSDMWVIGALQTIRNFTAFNSENDPCDEHNLILTRYDGKGIRAQFSYYEDERMGVRVKDAEDCYRVLTIGMADENF